MALARIKKGRYCVKTQSYSQNEFLGELELLNVRLVGKDME